MTINKLDTMHCSLRVEEKSSKSTLCSVNYTVFMFDAYYVVYTSCKAAAVDRRDFVPLGCISLFAFHLASQ